MNKIDWSKAPNGTTGAMVAHFDGETVRRGDVEFIPSAGERSVYGEGPDAWVYHPMPKPFEREERYIVVKIKDALAVASDEGVTAKDAILSCIKEWGITTCKGLVIEKDWPEYELTWAAIERRVTGAPAWVGIGPPPAGTVCEIKRVPHGHWGEGTVRFSSSNVIVWDWADEPMINGQCTAYAHEVECRPIRTPEQIAAEEQAKAVHQMGLDAGFSGSVQEFAERLYQAGYRKQVAP